MSEANLHVVNESVALEARDAKLAREMHDLVVLCLTALGEEESRHERTRADILTQLRGVERDYESIIRGLAKKYAVGKCEFSPELGAFVGIPAKKEG